MNIKEPKPGMSLEEYISALSDEYPKLDKFLQRAEEKLAEKYTVALRGAYPDANSNDIEFYQLVGSDKVDKNQFIGAAHLYKELRSSIPPPEEFIEYDRPPKGMSDEKYVEYLIRAYPRLRHHIERAALIKGSGGASDLNEELMRILPKEGAVIEYYDLKLRIIEKIREKIAAAGGVWYLGSPHPFFSLPGGDYIYEAENIDTERVLATEFVPESSVFGKRKYVAKETPVELNLENLPLEALLRIIDVNAFHEKDFWSRITPGEGC